MFDFLLNKKGSDVQIPKPKKKRKKEKEKNKRGHKDNVLVKN